MAQKCANCGSSNTQTQLRDYICLNCGKTTDYDGNVSQSGLDQEGRDRVAASLEPLPEGHGIVGNLADLQRAGAAIVKGEGSTLADGVEAPPGHDHLTTTKSKKK